MATHAQVSEYANLLLDKYGNMILKAFTDLGADYLTVSNKTILGRLAARGRIRVGSGQSSERYVKEWSVDTASRTAVAYGANDAYAADSADTYGVASIDWKRVGTQMGWDDLVNMTNLPLRDGSQPLSKRLAKRLDSILSKISADLFTDGTGTSGKDFTGYKAFMSVANTYAGISQSPNSYWRAQRENAGSSALSITHLENLIGAMDDLGLIRDGDTEIWTGRTQWLAMKGLSSPFLQYTNSGNVGDNIRPVYADGSYQIPIHILPDMPNTEVWVVNPNLSETELVFADHTPQEEVPAAPHSEAINHKQVPVGLKPIYNNTDVSGVWMRSYGNLVCGMPRANGYIDGLTT